MCVDSFAVSCYTHTSLDPTLLPHLQKGGENWESRTKGCVYTGHFTHLLDNAPQPIPYTLDRVTAEQQPERRVPAVAQLPDEFSALDGADGLAVVEPLDHALRVARGAGRRRVRLAGRGLDEEMAVAARFGRACAACLLLLLLLGRRRCRFRRVRRRRQRSSSG